MPLSAAPIISIVAPPPVISVVAPPSVSVVVVPAAIAVAAAVLLRRTLMAVPRSRSRPHPPIATSPIFMAPPAVP
jgi:hypothetical protein